MSPLHGLMVCSSRPGRNHFYGKALPPSEISVIESFLVATSLQQHHQHPNEASQFFETCTFPYFSHQSKLNKVEIIQDSVTRFTHSSCTGAKLSGIPKAAVRKIEATSPMFEEIKYLQMFLPGQNCQQYQVRSH